MYKKIFLLACVFCGFLSFTFAASWNLPGIKLITRAQWGADESIRYSSTSKTQRDATNKQQNETKLNQLMETDADSFFDAKQQEYEGQSATDYLLSVTPDEQVVDEYRESSSGKYLKWPESIHKNKTKIIIHHTASDYSSILTGGTGAAIAQMQAIYKYHTLTNGRGDIGYNFVIDPFGNIYEGRAGGEGVVGAHVSRNNTPSLGISLMGNFNVNVPTDASLKSLVNLSTALAKKYKIMPKATATYFKKSTEAPYLKAYKGYAIAGHKDAGTTACPGTNLYTLLPDIREQVTKNILKTQLITSLSGKKISSTSLSTTGAIVDGWYYSIKTTDTFTLPITWVGVKSCSSSDKSIGVVSCSSKNNELSITLTKKGTSGIKTISAVTSSGTKVFAMNLIRQQDFLGIAQQLKKDYMSIRNIKASSTHITKIVSKISLPEVKTLIQTPLSILLYELSVNYPRYEVSCDGGCTIVADTKTYTDTNPIVETSNGFVYLTLPPFENALAVKNLEISSISGGLVRIDNYARKSYAGILWNSFRGSLIWKKETLKNLSSGKFVEQAVVVNKTTFDNYMKGIGETSDSDSLEKQKLVLLLAKMYTLFYINGKNAHPSIPAGASYQAIDNPDMFQKYVGAGREKTSKNSANLLASIKNTVVLYSGYVPILPYFSCSAGFTWSAKEKWGWDDTPYLQSQLDFGACFDFNGHGVGLSGKGAQYLADQKGWTLEQILKYYYPGVEVKSTN